MTLSCIGGACRHRRPRAKDLHLDVALLDATVVDEGLTPSCHESTWAADVEVAVLARLGHQVACLVLQVALFATCKDQNDGDQ